MARTFHGGLAVAFADVEMFGHPDLAHRGVEVGAGIHQLDGAVVYGLHRVAHRGDFLRDPVGAFDRREVAGDQPLRSVCKHGVQRLDVKNRVAVAVAADGHQIRHMTE